MPKTDHTVKGEMCVKLIPPKRGISRVYHPMVCLFFRMDSGDEINIYHEESKNAKAIYEHLTQLLSTPDRPDKAHFIKSLYIPTFPEE